MLSACSLGVKLHPVTLYTLLLSCSFSASISIIVDLIQSGMYIIGSRVFSLKKHLYR